MTPPGRERQCTACGAAFTGRYRKCPACRPYRTDRTCAACGGTFRGEALKCSACQASPRQCTTCGTTFTSRYLECPACRGILAACKVPGCRNPKVAGQGSKVCQEHRDDAYERKLARLARTICYMPGCDEPKLAGTNAAGRRRPFRYCAKHSAEAPQRERAQMVRRARERAYGLTHDEYLALLEAQGGVCAICGNGSQRRGLAVDHNHETGQVRGLLCDRCNPLLGYAHDDVAILRAAIEYLIKWDQVFIPPQDV